MAEKFGEARTVSTYGSLDRITTLTKEWLQECEESHPRCANGLDLILPHRVLDVSSFETTGHIYLLETAGMPGAYIALSHCWGKHQPIKTTKESLSRFKAGIPTQSLPKTFLDATIVTNELGLRYLWIDCLCILQDSEQDWEEQSAQMADIYANSYLTLGASHATDSSMGLECQRKVFSEEGKFPEFRPVESYEIPGSNQAFGETIFVRHSQAQAHSDIVSKADIEKFSFIPRDEVEMQRRAPLLSRAWAFQERLLSPRILHCHSGELIWECKTGIACECKGLNQRNTTYSKVELSKISQMALPEVFDLWYSYVEKYSRLQLTYSSDCLPALSGPASWISRRISSSNDVQYFAGLWHRDFALGLLWSVDKRGDTTTIRRRSPYQAPTWSWASVHGPIVYRQEFRRMIRPDFKIHDVFCKTEGKNVFGKVSSGFFTCRGTVLPGRVVALNGSVGPEYILSIEGLRCFLWRNGPVGFSPDAYSWLPGPEQLVHALVISFNGWLVEGLVLRQCETASQEYTRLGHFLASEPYPEPPDDGYPRPPDDGVRIEQFSKTIKVL